MLLGVAVRPPDRIVDLHAVDHDQHLPRGQAAHDHRATSVAGRAHEHAGLLQHDVAQFETGFAPNLLGGDHLHRPWRIEGALRRAVHRVDELLAQTLRFDRDLRRHSCVGGLRRSRLLLTRVGNLCFFIEDRLIVACGEAQSSAGHHSHVSPVLADCPCNRKQRNAQ